MPEVSAAELRASLCRKGPRPLVQSWDLVLLLRLTDGQLLDLHHRLTSAHHRGADLVAVQPPAGVARYQARLLARFIVEAPRRDRGRRVVREPGVVEAERKLEGLVDRAEEAQRQADHWLDRNAPKQAHRRVDIALQQGHHDSLPPDDGQADGDEGGSLGL